MPKRVPYGGQAVIEGVMIRGRNNIAIAVRRPDNEIQLKTDPVQSLFTGTLKKVPFVRGFITLLEVMVIGTRALMYSAQVAIDEAEDEDGKKVEAGSGTGFMLWATLAVGLAFGIAVFFVGPVFLNEWLDDRIRSAAALNVIEGAVRLGLFLGYILLIGRMKDIQRVFAYHGAEHMSIHAMEHDEELSVDNVRKYTTLHPRCGTAFLLLVVLIAILVFLALGHPPLWIRIVSRIALLPVIAGISYEVLRIHGRYAGNRLLKVLLGPGLLLQMLTTRRPDDDQIEVAIAALKGAIAADGEMRGAVTPSSVS